MLSREARVRSCNARCLYYTIVIARSHPVQALVCALVTLCTITVSNVPRDGRGECADSHDIRRQPSPERARPRLIRNSAASALLLSPGDAPYGATPSCT